MRDEAVPEEVSVLTALHRITAAVGAGRVSPSGAAPLAHLPQLGTPGTHNAQGVTGEMLRPSVRVAAALSLDARLGGESSPLPLPVHASPLQLDEARSPASSAVMPTLAEIEAALAASSGGGLAGLEALAAAEVRL